MPGKKPLVTGMKSASRLDTVEERIIELEDMSKTFYTKKQEEKRIFKNGTEYPKTTRQLQRV